MKALKNKYALTAIFLLNLILPNTIAQTWEWESFFNNGYDDNEPFAMAVDGKRNIIIAGLTGHTYDWNDPSAADYQVVKYSPSGEKIWDVPFDDGKIERVTDVAVDSQCNVYVTGSSRLVAWFPGPYQYFNYITIKYDPDGNEIWSAKYEQVIYLLEIVHDLAPQIALDNQDNVYIVGHCNDWFSATSYDILTIKYTTDTFLNSVTGKYEPVVGWVKTYNSSDNGADYGHFIAVDDNDDVYIAGISSGFNDPKIVTIKYRGETGEVVWIVDYLGSHQPSSMVIDGASYCYITSNYKVSHPNYDFQLIKYDAANGNILWDVTHDFYGDRDYTRSSALDSNGNILVNGGAKNAANDFFVATVKYDPDGTVQWEDSYWVDYGTYVSVVPINIKVDRADNLYVASKMNNGGEDYDWKIVKYNGADGNEIWSDTYGGIAAGRDWPGDLAIDLNDNLIVTGTVLTDPINWFTVISTLKYGNTQPGPNVEVHPDPSSQFTFDQIITPGVTTVEYISVPPEPIPSGYQLGGPGGEPTYMDINTTAIFTGNVELGFNYDEALFTNESEVKLLHYDEVLEEWQDITTWVDMNENIVYGQTAGFSYFAITQTILQVEIDIKPGSFPNKINLGSNGVVQVALLGSADFDAETIDPLTVTLANSTVKLKGNGTPQANYQDVNNDGYMDLVLHLLTNALELTQENTEAVLIGKNYDYTITIKGVDTVQVVPAE